MTDGERKGKRLFLACSVSFILAAGGFLVYMEVLDGNPNEYGGEPITDETVGDLRCSWRQFSFDEYIKRPSFSMIEEKNILVHLDESGMKLVFARIDPYAEIFCYDLNESYSYIEISESADIMVLYGLNGLSGEGETLVLDYYFLDNDEILLDEKEMDLPSCNRMVISPDGNLMALSNTWYETGSIFDLREEKEIFDLYFESISFSPEGRKIIFHNGNYIDRRIEIIDLDRNETILSIDGGYGGNMDWKGHFSWKPDSSEVAAIVEDSLLTVSMDDLTITERSFIDYRNGRFNAVSYSPDGKLMAVGVQGCCGDSIVPSKLRVYDTEEWDLLMELEEYTTGPEPWWFNEEKTSLCIGEFPRYVEIQWLPEGTGLISSTFNYEFGGSFLFYSIGEVKVDDYPPIIFFVPSIISLLVIGYPVIADIFGGQYPTWKSLDGGSPRKRNVSYVLSGILCIMITLLLGFAYTQQSKISNWEDPLSVSELMLNIILSFVIAVTSISLISTIFSNHRFYLKKNGKNGSGDILPIISLFMYPFTISILLIDIWSSLITRVIPDSVRTRTVSFGSGFADIFQKLDPMDTKRMDLEYTIDSPSNPLVLILICGAGILVFGFIMKQFLETMKDKMEMKEWSAILITISLPLIPFLLILLAPIIIHRFFWNWYFPLITNYGEKTALLDIWPERIWIEGSFGANPVPFLIILFLLACAGYATPSFLKWLLSSFSRLSEDGLASNARRTRILEFLGRNPWTTTGRICEELRIPRSSMRYHIALLEKAGKVESEFQNGRRVFRLPVTEKDRYHQSRDEKILSIINSRPGISQKDLISVIDTSRSTLNRELIRLVHRGEIKRIRNGRTWRFYPVP